MDGQATTPLEQGSRQRRCVLIVHGVGEQRKSSTLLYIGSPLVSWVMNWARQFYTVPTVEVGRVELSFVPYDIGDGDKPPLAVLELPDQEWYFAEAWWAGSNFHPDLQTMLQWSLVHLGDIVVQMLRNTVERGRYLLKPRARAASSQPSRVWQLVDLLNSGVLLIGYSVAMVVGYVLLVPLMLLAQIPIESVQNFVVLKLLQPMLTAGAGEFRIYLDDELQAANIRRRVGDAARYLMQAAQCSELIIVAHSEGCVVTLGTLTDPVYHDVAASTRKLLTFGAGLNKSWLISPALGRLYTPLVADALWVDFWASYDPVPAGRLDPGRHVLADGKRCQITDIYKPFGAAEQQAGAGKPPISEQVTNGMNVLTDHGGYFANDEQVLLRLAAEISAEQHTDSAFWPDEQVRLDGIRARRTRVSVLTLWRDIAFILFATSAVLPWLTGWLKAVDPWQPVAHISPQAIGLAAVVLDALTWLSTPAALPPILAPVSSVAGVLLALPAVLGLALVVGLVVWAVYSLGQWLVWQRWDTSARSSFVAACAASSQQRLKSAPIPGTTIAAVTPVGAPPV